VAEQERFGRYQVFECVGSGGMATVHRASVEIEGQFALDVALKRLLPHLADDERFISDFVREAKLSALLHHPNIVRVYELGRIDDVYFIAMELVRGVAISKLLRKDRPPPIGVTLAMMLELTDALDYAHDGIGNHGQRINLVHRDLSPSNLLVTDDGHLKIIDFGVAKTLTGEHATSSGYAKGKLGYMSPEALRATNVDGRADLFSVGVVMWELLTGRRLFNSEHDWDLSIFETPVVPPSSINKHVPPALDQIVLKATAQDISKRWQSANAMHRALALAVRPFAAEATVSDVIAWRRSHRVASSLDAYVDYEQIEIVQSRTRTPATPTPAMKRFASTTPAKRAPSRAKSEGEERTGGRRRPAAIERTTESNRPVGDAAITSDLLPQIVTERQLEFPPEPTSSGEYVVQLFVEFEPSDFEREEPTAAAPTIPRKKVRAPIRRPAPAPTSDRIPRRLQVDTEPTPHPAVKPRAPTSTPRKKG